jgi:hypothetical protein
MKAVHADDLERCLNALRIASITQQPFQMRLRLERIGGIYQTVAFRGVPWFLLNEEFAGHVATVRELSITKDRLGDHRRYTIGEALNELAATFAFRGYKLTGALRTHNATHLVPSAKTLLACFDYAPARLLVLNGTGRVVYCNSEFRRLAETELRARSEAAQVPQTVTSQATMHYRPAKSVDPVQSWLDSPPISDKLLGSLLVQMFYSRKHRLACFSVADYLRDDHPSFRDRAFLHKVFNTAAGIEMVTELLGESDLPREFDEQIRLLNLGVRQLMAQIRSQQTSIENTKPMAAKVS